MSVSLPAWGAWIEISTNKLSLNVDVCRSPHGERGLKSPYLTIKKIRFSRSPHGERGLKSDLAYPLDDQGKRRSPHGERGLKFCLLPTLLSYVLSLPAWGAWIEITAPRRRRPAGRSLPAWGAWIEISLLCPVCWQVQGRSPHGERGLK